MKVRLAETADTKRALSKSKSNLTQFLLPSFSIIYEWEGSSDKFMYNPFPNKPTAAESMKPRRSHVESYQVKSYDLACLSALLTYLVVILAAGKFLFFIYTRVIYLSMHVFSPCDTSFFNIYICLFNYSEVILA